MPSEITRSSGRFALPWGSPRTRLQLLLLAIGIATSTLVLSRAQVPVVQLEANDPGIGIVGTRFMIATPISNTGTANASNVQITAATLGSAHLLSPTAFPVALGSIGPGKSYVFQTDFDATGLTQDTSYPLTITGTYELNQVTSSFTLDLPMGLPPASPGSGTTATGFAYAEDLSGAPFPPYPIPLLGDDFEIIPVPVGPYVTGTSTLQSVAIQSLQGGGGIRTAGSSAVSIPTNESFVYLIKDKVAGDPNEPSGATGGGVLFLSFNWDGAYKADGYTHLQDPRTMFPQSPYPFRSDQQVQFASTIGRFIWIQQLSASGAKSAGAYRLAAASPEDIKTYGKTTNPSKAWKSWLITNDTVGLVTNTTFDMPSLAVGDDYLYASWDVGCPSGTPTGPCIGLEVVRISLSDIKAGINPLPVTHVVDPGQSGGCPPAVRNRNSCFAHNAFLSQDTGDQVFWAGHNGTTQLRFFNWPAGNLYYWRDVGPIHGYKPNQPGGAAHGHIPSSAPYPIYAENPPTQPASDDWLYRRAQDPIHGATRSGSKVYLAWSAAPHEGIPYPYFEVVIVDISDYSFEHEEIYSPSYALGLASLANNACTHEVGISLAYGGNGQYPNHAVGFLNDTTYYGTTIGSVTGSAYGDYLNIRQNNTASLNRAFFDAFGYALTQASGTGTVLTKDQVNVDIRHVVFGRPGACAP